LIIFSDDDEDLLETSLVFPETGDGHEPLFPREPERCAGRVGKNEENDDAPDRADCANDEKLVTPRRQRAVNVSDGVLEDRLSKV
jgi:hypothetical protein